MQQFPDHDFEMLQSLVRDGYVYLSAVFLVMCTRNVFLFLQVVYELGELLLVMPISSAKCDMVMG